MIEPTEVVRRFWDSIEARDWDAAGALLDEQVTFEWPHSGERFVGRDVVIGMNRAYPEGWRIEVQRIIADGPSVVSLVRVPLGADVSLAASFFEVRDGSIHRAVELWVDERSREPPEWRRPFAAS